MFNKKAQTINEYVILAGIILAACVAMQGINKRLLQARIKDIADFIGPQTVNRYDPARGDIISSEVRARLISTHRDEKAAGPQGGVYHQVDEQSESKAFTEYIIPKED